MAFDAKFNAFTYKALSSDSIKRWWLPMEREYNGGISAMRHFRCIRWNELL